MKVRPFPESGLDSMKEWFIDQTWDQVFKAESAHQKAEIFQQILDETRKVQSDDQPFITQKLKQMDRKRKRVFNKERESEK